MQHEIELSIAPEQLALGEETILSKIQENLNISRGQITHFEILRSSLDARRRPPRYSLRVRVFVDEEFSPKIPWAPRLQNVSKAEEVIIIGSGPAGLFAALRLVELGLKPVIFERGKAVRDRRHDIAALNKKGVLNPESNYCFGEGGAGTFSDGKLYTRSTKRGPVEKVLKTLVYFGAKPEILIEAHPHVGTNKLPRIVQAIRESILECGGEIHFNTKVIDFGKNSSGKVFVRLADQSVKSASSLILATGHSARDIFTILHRSKILIEPKPFALGVRVEHPQEFIDSRQYGFVSATKARGSTYLPAASYALKAQVGGRGVFSFCMCPGGIICPAATSANEVVVNGWSPSKRNSFYANSGVVVEIRNEDLVTSDLKNELAGLSFQQSVENKAWQAAGGMQKAPAQRLTDFMQKKISANLPRSSYIPGLTSVELSEVLPSFVWQSLTSAMRTFDKSIKGYIQEQAVVVAVESRTSSPLRIPRDSKTLMHPKLTGLFPCGEGAGYAGGIVSAALDGIKCAEAAAVFRGVSCSDDISS